ncbi:MAG TPA: Cys-tRNA(Pro) deacylase [Rhodocyclaceae bacterium]|jgi:Cys-tRNA(Pro) deacylase|nr:Cys-tRNA(Pro) deacylase [Rhodocyclaceae bacterium]
MSKHDLHVPETPATQFLKKHGITYGSHPYAYEEHGGTSVSARELDVAEHDVIKTLIMEDENARPLVMLMHGDCKVSTKELARQAGVKKIAPCAPDTANRHSGFLIGGTSPFGTKKSMPVFMERSILEVPLIYINGGKRGYLVSVKPQDIVAALQAKLVDVALPD